MSFSKAQRSLVLRNLQSLGCAFYQRPANHVADLEQTIIEGLDYFWSDKALFDMLLGLLQHRLHGLVNIERLTALGKKLKGGYRTLLLFICHRLERVDRRYAYAIKQISRDHHAILDVPKDYQSLRLLKHWGCDPDFKKLNFEVANFFGEKSSKFLDLRAIFKLNPWLRTRSLVGANYRADIIYLKASNKASRPQECAKILGCQRATAYNIWATLEEISQIKTSKIFTEVTFPRFLVD